MEISILLFLASLELGALIFVTYKCLALARVISRERKERENVFSALVIAATRTGSLSVILAGMTRLIKRKTLLPIRIYECSFDQTSHSLDDVLFAIAHQKIDLVIPCGTAFTERVLHILKKNNMDNVGVISCGAIAEVLTPPLQSYRKQQMQVTGTFGSLSWNEYLQTLKRIYPFIQNIVMVYPMVNHMSHSIAIDKNNVTYAAYLNKITCHMHHISSLSSIDISKELLKKIDFVIFSRGFGQISHMGPYLFSYFEKHGIPILWPDVQHVHSGVFMAMANLTEEEIGTHTARQLLQYASGEKTLNQIPMETIDAPVTIAINLLHNNRPLVERAIAFASRENEITRIITKPH